MFGLLTFGDLLSAAVLAAILTWLIVKLIDLIQSIKSRSIAIENSVTELEDVLAKCYDLFPKELMQFNGEIFKRGMQVRIITSQNKIFEGKFLGFNNDNMVCMMTKKFIIAHAVANITEMEILD